MTNLHTEKDFFRKEPMSNNLPKSIETFSGFLEVQGCFLGTLMWAQSSQS